MEKEQVLDFIEIPMTLDKRYKGMEDINYLPATLKKDALAVTENPWFSTQSKYFLSYFCVWRGMLCQRWFAVKFIRISKKTAFYRLFVEEVARVNEQELWLSGQYDYHGLAGWIARFNPDSVFNVLRIADCPIPSGLWAANSPTLAQAMQFKELLPPYFCYDPEGNDGYTFWKYLKRFKEHPQLEMYFKMGFGWMYRDKRMLRTDKPWLRFLRMNKKDIEQFRRNMNYSVLLCMFKNGWSYNRYIAHLNEIKRRKEAEEASHQLTLYVPKATIEDGFKLMAYLDKQDCYGTSYYFDYIKSCVKLGMSLGDQGVMFPRNLREAHDTCTKMVQEKAQEEKKQAVLKKIEEAKLPAKVDYKEAEVISYTDFNELVKVADELKICVAHCGYYDKMSRGESFILGVMVAGKLENCVEIDKGLKVLQNRGFHNAPSEHQELAEKAVAKYCQVARKARREVQA